MYLAENNLSINLEENKIYVQYFNLKQSTKQALNVLLEEKEPEISSAKILGLLIDKLTWSDLLVLK